MFSEVGASTRREVGFWDGCTCTGGGWWVGTDFLGYDHCDGKRNFGAGVTARDVDWVFRRVRDGKTDLRGGCECAGAETVFRGRFTG